MVLYSSTKLSLGVLCLFDAVSMLACSILEFLGKPTVLSTYPLIVVVGVGGTMGSLAFKIRSSPG